MASNLDDDRHNNIVYAATRSGKSATIHALLAESFPLAVRKRKSRKASRRKQLRHKGKMR